MVGLLLLLSGVGLLGWVGWQTYVTTWISHQRQADVVEALRTSWDRPPPADGGELVRVDAGGPVTAGAVVRIPALGDDWQMPVLQGIGDDELAAGIGHFPDSAAPGDAGNFALAGHRVTHGEPLRDMPDLDAGDRVVVETRDRVFTYVLDTGGDDLTVSFDQSWVVNTRPMNPEGGVGPAPRQDHLITLTTCAELFHTDDRLVAFGHLVATRER